MKFKVIDLSVLSPNSLGIVDSQKQNIIPLRRMFLSTIAGLYIFQNNINILSIGSQNPPQYPDGTTEYIETVEKLIKDGLDNEKFKIEKPFFNLNKNEIIKKYYDKELFELIFS